MQHPDQTKLTTDTGTPVVDNQRSQTAGPSGPTLLQDHHLIEKLARFDRERIPERGVHARGSGAGGFFEVTADVSQWTKAAFLQPVGKRTEVFVRFSTVKLEPGSADCVRDPRGFVLKFYTEEGNYDLVGNNTLLPVNCPHATQARTYGRDGPVQTNRPSHVAIAVEGVAGEQPPAVHRDDEDFSQAGSLYRLMTEAEKERLAAALAESLAE